MKLTRLDAFFVRHERRAGSEIMQHVDKLSDAQGLIFACPICRLANCHSIGVWFRDRGVPDEATPTGRWFASGPSLRDLTLSPSICIV
ncbi:MAG TPA: hypothetical protein VM580_34055, partial [Labilithrix sp.]|nr:hypothetical protein [Labilithrix sp.]